MPDDLATQDRKAIATRAIAGAAWSIGLVVVLSLLRFVNAKVLSDSVMKGAEAYGFWTYLNMLLMVLPSLFIFGGPRVLVYFVPKLEGDSKRRFVWAFGLLAVGGVLAGLGIVFLFPSVAHLIGVEQRTGLIAVFMIVAIPLETVTLVLDAALMGAMRLADAEKARSLPQVIVIVGLTALFLVRTQFCFDHYVVILTAAMSLRLMIALVWYMVLYQRAFPRHDRDGSSRGWFPPDMWRYAGFLQMNQLMDFVYMQGDQWIVYGFFNDLKILAGYNIARTLTRFIGMIPMALRGIVFSTLVQFQGEQDMDRSRRTFRLSVLVDSLVSFPIALMMVCFCQDIVGFIGRQYREGGVAGEVLLVMAGLAAVTNLGGSLSVYIMGRGRSNYTFWVALVGSAAQLAFTWLFLSLQGSAREAQLGITIARFLGLFLMLGLTAWWMRRNMPRAIPSAWMVNAATVLVVSVLVYFCQLNRLESAALFVVGSVLVTAVNLYQMDPVIRRLVMSPWRMLSVVLDEQKMPSGGRKTNSKPSGPPAEGSSGP